MTSQQLATGNSARSKSTILASLAALGSVILASSCCLPLLPFLFAAGAAGSSVFFVKVRPFLLAASVLLIGFGFYQRWRAKQCNCKPNLFSAILLWFSAAVVFVFIFFPQPIANFLANLLAGWIWSNHSNETHGNYHSCCTDDNCIPGILLFLLGQHRSQRTATSRSFKQFEYFIAQGCLQWLGELRPIGRGAFSYLNGMFAGSPLQSNDYLMNSAIQKSGGL